MSADPEVLNIIEAGLQAERFLGSELARKLCDRAQKEANRALQEILAVDISLPADEYKSQVVALVMEVNRRENAIHWISDALQEFVAHEEAAAMMEPLE